MASHWNLVQSAVEGSCSCGQVLTATSTDAVDFLRVRLSATWTKIRPGRPSPELQSSGCQRAPRQATSAPSANEVSSSRGTGGMARSWAAPNSGKVVEQQAAIARQRHLYVLRAPQRTASVEPPPHMNCIPGSAPDLSFRSYR